MYLIDRNLQRDQNSWSRAASIEAMEGEERGEREREITGGPFDRRSSAWCPFVNSCATQDIHSPPHPHTPLSEVPRYTQSLSPTHTTVPSQTSVFHQFLSQWFFYLFSVNLQKRSSNAWNWKTFALGKLYTNWLELNVNHCLNFIFILRVWDGWKWAGPWDMRVISGLKPIPNTAPLFTDFLYCLWPFDSSSYQLAGNERLP